MYRKILVPLDGSELAECVLPHVESIAGGCGVQEVVFLRVVEPVSLPSGTWTDGGAVFTEANFELTRRELDAKNESEAKDYLGQVVARFKPEGVKVHEELIKGKAADELVDYIQKSDADLVIIASHGRSGISRWIHGSVAERLLRTVCVPLLMIRAPGCVLGI